jgi:hypothetical protein
MKSRKTPSKRKSPKRSKRVNRSKRTNRKSKGSKRSKSNRKSRKRSKSKSPKRRKSKPNYRMFTPEGNAIVAEIVKTAKSKQWSWKKVESALDKLSKRAGYGEAMDTVVREIFADELGLLD